MVNDMYAIYESYLTKESVGAASANNTERGNVNISYRPFSQGSTFGDLGQDNEEINAPKEIAKLIKSIVNCAQKGDYSGIVVDCMRLSKVAGAHIKK
jgi:hypothetical protein